MSALVWTVTIVVGMPLAVAFPVALVWLFQPATGPGTHQAGGPDGTTRAALIFRRAIAAVRRRLPVPAVAAAGTGTVLLADAEPERYDCCPCCDGDGGTQCDPPDSHPVPCEDCNGVLRDRWTWEVRAEQDAQRHADAMHEASEPYLPPSPAGQHPYPPCVRADLPVTPVDAGHAPWTGAQPVLDEAALAELDRRAWVRSQLPANPEHVTEEDMRRAIAGLRAMPVYGQAPVARVLEAERLAAVMRP